jgi:hypothetical protein
MTKTQRNGIVSTGCLYKSGMRFITIHLQIQQKKKRIIMMIITEKIQKEVRNRRQKVTYYRKSYSGGLIWMMT